LISSRFVSTSPTDLHSGSVTMTLTGLCARLDTLGRSPHPVLLQDWLSRVCPQPAELRPFIAFDATSYRRNLICRRLHFEVLLLCWRPEQQSPIHDHTGSQCSLLVLSGVATEVRFARQADGTLRAVSTQRCPTGAVASSQDADLHVLANWETPQADLLTLHVYTPPLDDMRYYPESLVRPATSVANLSPAPVQHLAPGLLRAACRQGGAR
jgi:hypothetical protein